MWAGIWIVTNKEPRMGRSVHVAQCRVKGEAWPESLQLCVCLAAGVCTQKASCVNI